MAWKQFARRIKTLREAKGWSQNQLATRASLRAADLSRILTGTRNVMPHHITSLAAALGESVDALIDGTGMQDVLDSQVPVERLAESERSRAVLQGQLDELRASLDDARDVVLEVRRLLGTEPSSSRASSILAHLATRIASELRGPGAHAEPTPKRAATATKLASKRAPAAVSKPVAKSASKRAPARAHA